MFGCTGTRTRRLSIGCVVIVLILPACVKAQDENDVRLVDGPNANEGRVEIFNGGVWFSVCRGYVSNEFGSVACRQLNYSADVSAMYWANSYGSAPGEILRQSINCYGYETSLSNLSQCKFIPLQQNCDPSYTLGLSCDTGVSEVQPVRLVNGTSPYEGRVEVFKSGVWGTVTDTEYYYFSSSSRSLFNTIAANIVCRALFGPSYGGSAVPRQEAALRFGVARRRAIQMSNIQCEGNEQVLHNCTYNDPWMFESLEDSLAVVCKPVPDGCNGYIAASSGTVHSPNFTVGEVYSNNTDCVWKIVNMAGKIQLSFNDIQANATQTTALNILQVLDSDAGPTLAIIQRPTVSSLVSSGNSLFLWLKATAGTTGIQYSASWDIPPCFERIYEANYIQSPGYPSQYQPNLSCTYEIVKRKGVWIIFSFNYFALGEQQTGLCQDSLQIFDGNSKSSPTVGGPLCGTTLPTSLSTSNVMSTTVLVRFTSDAVNTSVERGFQIYASYGEPDPIRPGNYTEDSGSFQSPGYPDVYNGEEDIIWTITTKPYKTITLSFQDVQIGYCCDNSITVYDGSIWLQKFFNNTLSSVVSNGNGIAITFVSTLDNAFNKLNASWTAECRHVFQTTTGIITSPTESDFNSSSADCTYIIRQQAGYYISIQFSALSFEQDQRCRNYIEIHDGSTEFFPLLGERYCGLSLPPPLNSTQNIVYMKFSTQTGYNSFNLTYTSYLNECDNGLMTDNNGSFTSPGFQAGYPKGTYCVWIIKPYDNDTVIDLFFYDFSVGYHQGTQCRDAMVRVYDGPVLNASTVVAT